MELEEKSDRKVASFLSSKNVITYKRRKLGKRNVSPVKQISKTSSSAALCNGNCESCEQVRIVHNWRHVLQQLGQSTYVEDNCVVGSCIQTALLCGPLGFSDKSNIKNLQFKDRQKGNNKLGQARRCKRSPKDFLIDSENHKEVKFDGLDISEKSVLYMRGANLPCLNAFFDVLISQKFSLLCDLLCENFLGIKDKCISDFGLIISKMKDGVYNQSLDILVQDIELVWKKIQMTGEETARLADGLFSISRESSMKQEREFLGASGEYKLEDDHPIVKKEKNFAGLYSKVHVTSYNSNSNAKFKHTDASHLHKDVTCKQCGSEGHASNSLVCDACEGTYHVLCIKPAVQKFPPRSWYCSACLSRNGCLESNSTNNQQDYVHEKCRVRQKLECSGCPEVGNERPDEVLKNLDPEDTSSPSKKSDELPETSANDAVLPLCKLCGKPEEDDKMFLVCSHHHCPYKYYHIRCLKSTQVASWHQQPNQWYCPSCLCRDCLTDKDDELICMCDACDEGYHIYCMKPPRTAIPDGTWYCSNCEKDGRARADHNKEEHDQMQNLISLTTSLFDS